MKKALFGMFALIATFFNQSPLQAEIQQVDIFWTAAACDERCVRFLERQLKAIPGVQSVKVFPEGGTAELFWKPRSEFKWERLNLAMKRLGLKLKETQVSIRGTISHAGNNFFITSLGDATKLEILSPALLSETQYVERNNVQSHLVREPLRSQLLEVEKNHQLVLMKGPLFEPWRGGNYIIADSVTIQ